MSISICEDHKHCEPQSSSHAVTMPSSSPAPHKPRRKPKNSDNDIDKPVRVRSEALVRTPSFPLAAFLWPARTSSSQWEVLPLILMVVGLFRWAAGLWGYSGEACGNGYAIVCFALISG